MKPLSKWQTFVMLAGGLLMVVGSGANMLFAWWAPYVFAPGALMFASMQMCQTYDGPLFVVRRLRRMVLLSDVLFLLAGLMMLAGQSNFFHLYLMFYIKYVHNNWVIVLLIAAILQLYAGHRIANELEKEAKKR